MPEANSRKIDWSTPCSICGGKSHVIVYGGERDCDPDKVRYLCRPCEARTKDHQS